VPPPVPTPLAESPGYSVCCSSMLQQQLCTLQKYVTAAFVYVAAVCYSSCVCYRRDVCCSSDAGRGRGPEPHRSHDLLRGPGQGLRLTSDEVQPLAI
jgi:hypothetical protein